VKIKAVQLDLARQKENLEYVKSFIDFISRYGINTLVLYLEAVIRTKTFPWIEEKFAYEPAEIKEIVAYAAKYKIDVMPVVATFAHTERFLRHKQLAHLAELAGEEQGRWPYKVFDTMCPSNEETYKFLTDYLKEIAPLFPSKYLHVGMDENWQIGMCPACKKRFDAAGRGDEIFAEHISRIHKVVKKLGKTMVMWDDMFEMYPAALEMIPRDIVMCTWVYNYSIEKVPGHFLNSVNKDIFAEYDRLGFKYIFGSRDLLVPNTLTFTKYAMRHKPLGGLVTSWAREVDFYFQAYPHYAMAGRLWNARDPRTVDTEKLLEEVIAEVCETSDPAVIAAIKSYNYLRDTGLGLRAVYARGEVNPLEEEHARALETILKVLENCGSNNEIIEDTRISVAEKLANYRLRKAVPEYILCRIHGEEQIDVKPLLKARQDVFAKRQQQWHKVREGISGRMFDYHKGADKNYYALLENIDKADYFAFVRFFLPDPWGCPWATITVHTDKGEEITVLNKTTLKAPIEDQAYYEYVFPFKAKGRPVSAEIKVYGYGGQGVSYIHVTAKDGRDFVPAGITGVRGQAASPTDVLVDDLRWCYLGEREVFRGFIDQEFGHIPHSIQISLKASE
jgi:hypothetical protein